MIARITSTVDRYTKFIAMVVVAVSTGFAHPTEEYGTGSNAILNFYQKNMSPAKGGNTCTMHPSCSQYAKIAISENPGRGVIKTFDRLMRCGRDAETYQRCDATGKLYDPPDSMERQRIVNGSIPPEVESIIGIRLPERMSEGMSRGDFFLLHRRMDDALREAYTDLYDAYLKNEPDEALVRAGQLHLAAGDFEGFRRLYHIFTSGNALSLERQAEFDLLLAKCFYFQGEFEKSLSTLAIIDTGRFSARIKDEACFLLALNHVRRADFTKVKAAAAAISTQSPRRYFAERCRDLDHLRFNGRFRNPAVAGALSAIVPGMGYAYGGREKTAVAAAIINGFFIWTAVEAFRKDNFALGATASFLGSGWYFGNIYGSITSARAFNESVKIEFIRSTTINP